MFKKQGMPKAPNTSPGDIDAFLMKVGTDKRYAIINCSIRFDSIRWVLHTDEQNKRR